MNDISVAVGIVIRGNRVLLVQRTIKEGLLNWQFPAGKIESGENPSNAAEREIYEETGIKSKSLKNIGFRKHPITDVLIHYIICEYISGKEKVRDIREIQTLKWVKPVDLKAFIPEKMYPGIIDYFELDN